MRSLFGTGDACYYGEPFQLRMFEPFDFEDASKDFSSYHNEIGTNSDFSYLLEVYRPPCEYYRGVLHVITGGQTCGGDEADSGTIYNVTNVPYCAFPGCSIDEGTIEESESFDFCEDNDWRIAPKDYVVEIEDKPILGEKCNYQLASFSDRVPSSPLDEDFLDWNNYDVNGDGSVYDFSEIVEDFVDVCESEGGYLYKFSEQITGNGLHDYDEDGYALINYPMCLGSSCDPDAYFEDLYIPTWRFETEGKFWAADEYDEMGYNAEQSYEFLGFQAVASPGDNEEDEEDDYYEYSSSGDSGNRNNNNTIENGNGDIIGNGDYMQLSSGSIKDSSGNSGSGRSKAGTFFGALLTVTAFVATALFAKGKMNKRRDFDAIQREDFIALRSDAEIS